MTICPNCGQDNREGLVFCSNCGTRLDSYEQDPNVKRCSYCNKPLVGEDSYYFTCRYCGKIFCSEHRLPENHLCASNPMRRTLPSTSNPYYSSGGGYSFPTYSRRRSSFGLNISRPGRNLIIAIFAGLVIGAITSLIYIDGVPLVFFLIQINSLVFQGLGIPSLATSMIVVLSPIPVPFFGSSWNGVIDVAFNAFAVWIIDGLLRNTYSSRQYYFVFFITGLAGNLLSLIGEPLGTASMGASGGIFGLIAGAVTADYAINRRVNFSLLAWFLFIFIISTFGTGLSIDIFAHLGGALVGLVAGYFVGISRRRRAGY